LKLLTLWYDFYVALQSRFAQIVCGIITEVVFNCLHIILGSLGSSNTIKALHSHDDAFFGLTKSNDQSLFGTKAGMKWQPPNASKIKNNKAKEKGFGRTTILVAILTRLTPFQAAKMHGNNHENKHVKLVQYCCTKQAFALLQISNQRPLVSMSRKGLKQES